MTREIRGIDREFLLETQWIDLTQAALKIRLNC
jgi:hypothetical protein